MLSKIISLASLLCLCCGSSNNNPNFSIQKVWNCSNSSEPYVRPDGTCEITFVVEPFLSMTYYGPITEEMRELRGYRAYYDGINIEPQFIDETIPEAVRDELMDPITADGCFRSLIAINGQMPGPMIIVNENQHICVTVHNELPNVEGISIHWHGMIQRGTPGMDGVAYITQLPILTHQSFVYEFDAYPSGTHWYHAHSGAQRTDGMYGALIVKDTLPDPDIIDMPEDYTFILMDWQNEASIDLFYQIRSSTSYWKEAPERNPPYSKYIEARAPDNSQIAPTPFWSGIINDKGRHYNENDEHNNAQLNVFSVNPNKKYRFRLIGAQSLYAYRFSIEGHKFSVVATDGNMIEPIDQVDYIIVNTGERYDVVLNTEQNISDYWIIAETLESPTPLENQLYNSIEFHVAEAILHYGEPSSFMNMDPIRRKNNCSNQQNPCLAVNCPFKNYPPSFNIRCNNSDTFQSVGESFDQLPPVKTLFYSFGFDGEHSTRGSSVDGINFRFPSSPPVTDYQQFQRSGEMCQGGCSRSTDYATHCACTHVIDLSNYFGSTIQIVITNRFTDSVSNVAKPESSHPIHLHGQSFNVVKIGYPFYYDNGTYMRPNEDIECIQDNGLNEPCEKWFINMDGENMQTIQWKDGIAPDDLENNISMAKNLKDTVIVPFGGYTVIRFTVDNQGWWFFHCHIEIHQLEGMSTVVKVMPGSALINTSQLWMVAVGIMISILIML